MKENLDTYEIRENGELISFCIETSTEESIRRLNDIRHIVEKYLYSHRSQVGDMREVEEVVTSQDSIPDVQPLFKYLNNFFDKRWVEEVFVEEYDLPGEPKDDQLGSNFTDLILTLVRLATYFGKSIVMYNLYSRRDMKITPGLDTCEK